MALNINRNMFYTDHIDITFREDGLEWWNIIE